MPHADQRAGVGEPVECRADARVEEIGPADDPGEARCRRRQPEEVVRLSRLVDDLHEDGPPHPRAVQLRLQLRPLVVAVDHCHRHRVDPRLRSAGQRPEVDVSVEHRGLLLHGGLPGPRGRRTAGSCTLAVTAVTG
ncbi:hypothetical protein [Nocardioides sp. TF02-7]|uniref:hypothetical protein n=1 Tax=Nocardioides sp. TF02-7 TaxID=2917724 RepID=UPI001F06AEDC|nr:hypothetical protein [Nocardioides sp. TF02-7]UMG91250.1 hypothetical protein MF408_13805 [Nocardioides sp. TF02-7]